MMNDWEIKEFLWVVVPIQLAMLVVVGLDTLGLRLPYIQQFLGFIYLTFIPGIILLRILRLHGIDAIKTLLFTVGLSIAFLMLFGLYA